MEKVIERNRVVCTAWYETNDYMWMCLSDRNAICKVNKKNKEVTELGRYPETEYIKEMLSFNVVYSRGKLVFVPHCADYIAVLEMETEILKFFKIKRYNHDSYEERGKFATALVKDQYIYMMGFWYPAIVKLDVESEGLEYLYYDDCIAGECEAPYVQLGYVKKDNIILMATGKNGCIMKFDMEIQKGEIIKLVDGKQSFFGITNAEKDVWLTMGPEKADKIYRWDIEANELETIMLPECGLFYPPIVCEDCLYLFPYGGKSIYVFSFKNKICSLQKELTDILMMGRGAARVIAIKQMGNVIKFQISGNRYWYEYNTQNLSLKKACYQMTDDVFEDAWIQKKKKELVDVRKNIGEKSVLLTEYISLIKTDLYSERCNEKSCGKTIYQL